MLKLQNRAPPLCDESNADLQDWSDADAGASYRKINGVMRFKGEKKSRTTYCPQFYPCVRENLPHRSQERDDDWDCEKDRDELVREGQQRMIENAQLITKHKTIDREYAWGEYDTCATKPGTLRPELYVPCTTKVDREFAPGMVQFGPKKDSPELYQKFEPNGTVKEKPLDYIPCQAVTEGTRAVIEPPNKERPKKKEIEYITGASNGSPDCPIECLQSYGVDKPRFDW